MKIRVDVDTARIMRERGLGGDNRARIHLASTVKRLSDKYVPMQQGLLKTQSVIASDGSTLTYTQPYAHYQYYGEAMAGRAPKQYTGKALDHHGAPLRGPFWDKRMMADRSKDVADDLKNYIGGLAK